MNATRGQLIVQFLGESVLTALLSLVLGLALVEVLLPAYGSFLGVPLAMNYLGDWPQTVAIVAVAVAAGLVARDYGAQTRHWLLMPDHGDNPTVKLAADVLGAAPFLQLGLGLGEGATARMPGPLSSACWKLSMPSFVSRPPVPVITILSRLNPRSI